MEEAPSKKRSVWARAGCPERNELYQWEFLPDAPGRYFGIACADGIGAVIEGLQAFPRIGNTPGCSPGRGAHCGERGAALRQRCAGHMAFAMTGYKERNGAATFPVEALFLFKYPALFRLFFRRQKPAQGILLFLPGEGGRPTVFLATWEHGSRMLREAGCSWFISEMSISMLFLPISCSGSCMVDRAGCV